MNINCAHCYKEFQNKDEVVITNAYGNKQIVHNECLLDFVLNSSNQEYFDAYEDLLEELE